jgi:hypothetical protein
MKKGKQATKYEEEYYKSTWAPVAVKIEMYSELT